MHSGGPIAPHPFVGCKGLESFPVMRNAWDAVQNDPRFDGCVPFRCRTCSHWHVAGSETLDELRVAGCLR